MHDHPVEPAAMSGTNREEINEIDPLSLTPYNIGGKDGLPSGCFYVPSFITEDEEGRILNGIKKTPASKWTNLSHRRLISLPNTLTGTARDTLIEAPLPEYLNDPVLKRLLILSIFQSGRSPHGGPNHALINEYQPGQGIMPHEDGPAYFPLTATVSLGSHTVLDIYKKNEGGERESKPSWRILQEPRSLLVTEQPMYRDTLHGISNVIVDEDLREGAITNWHLLADTTPYETGRCERQPRISLTFRDVLKVAKLGGAMKFLGKK
jgi:alkylated DNA repair protein alkB homolog 6